MIKFLLLAWLLVGLVLVLIERRSKETFPARYPNS